ncbi:hypothetical protein BDF22DRAFT_768244 [Syncephalis plumigaleata]|nr:hypothetical protein BDF22DRAFT_768244 [Syncephalis plumigaleata]
MDSIHDTYLNDGIRNDHSYSSNISSSDSYRSSNSTAPSHPATTGLVATPASMQSTRSTNSLGITRHPRPSILHGDRGGRDEVRTSATSSSDSNSGSNGGSSSLSGGAITGVIVGGLVFALLVIGAVITYRRHRRKKVKERFNAELWGSAGASSSVAINQTRSERHSGEYYSPNNLDPNRKSVSSRSGFRSTITNSQQQPMTNNIDRQPYPTRPPPPPPAHQPATSNSNQCNSNVYFFSSITIDNSNLFLTSTRLYIADKSIEHHEVQPLSFGYWSSHKPVDLSHAH